MIAHVWFLYSCLFAALVPQRSPQRYRPPGLSAVERYLYTQLEDALVNDAATLEQLREVFFQEQPRPNEIQFRNISITADSIPANNCSVCSPWPPHTCEPAFCPVNNITRGNTLIVQWELCSYINVTWKVPFYVDAIDLIRVLGDTVVPWYTHGPSIVILLTNSYASLPWELFFFDNHHIHHVREPIQLSVKKLNCQPHRYQLTYALGEFFSWIEVYTEAGGKPLTWDPQQQALIYADFRVKSSIHSSIWGAYWLDTRDWQTALKALSVYGLVGCLLLKLSLSLLIPRIFLGYHNKIVHKSTSPGFRSLYWGAAVISLFLVVISLFLVVTIMLGIFLYLPISFILFYQLILNFALEILIPIAYFIVSVIASKSSRAVPMPAAKFTTHVLFCWCCCFYCSPQWKSKGAQVLTLWAFMIFIYYNITEAVALVFTLFISIPLTVSFTVMYVSGVFFAIMLVAIILFSCQSWTTGRSNGTPAKCLVVVDVCATLLGISFIMHVFVAFIAMSPLFSHLKVKGFEAVALKFSLLPSIALSVAGWLIRKKLLKEDSRTVQQTHPTGYGATGHSLNDGDEEEQAPEEQQHLL